jgi:hypothetical protein
MILSRRPGRQPKLEWLENRVVPALVINPTFDSTIKSDPNAATIENTINQAISIYESYIADSITVNITFQEMSGGLGENLTYFVPETYSSYLAALRTHQTSTADAAALASLSAGANNPVNNGAMVNIRSPLARALGYSDASNENIPMDSTLSLNTSICNLSRPDSNSNNFDLLAVTMHEMDEVFGGGSALDGLAQGAAAPADIQPLDLYRYSGTGVRSYNTNSPTGPANQAYFSIDGGKTDLVNFNQKATGDFGDWYSYPNGAPNPPGPQVQDAFLTPGAAPNMGVELTRIDVLGFTLTTTPAVAFTSTPNVLIANESHVSAAGTGINGDTISVTITDGTHTTSAATTTVSGGIWSVSGINASSLSDGTVTYTVTETDSAGHGAVLTKTASKFTVAPKVTFTSTPDITGANENNVSAAGTGDNGDTISVTITDGTHTTSAATTTVSGGTWSVGTINASGLFDGTVTYSVVETDALGNTTTITQDANKVTSGPHVTFTSTPNINIADEGTLSAAGTGDNGDTISLTITDGTHTTSAATTTVSGGTWSVGGINGSSLSDGTVTYVVTETDGVGKTTTIRQAETKITVAPLVAFTSTPNINIADEGTISVAGTGNNGDTIALTISDGTHTVDASTAVSGGTWSMAAINASGLSDGSVTYIVTETDAAGNVTTIQQTEIKITVVPKVAFTSTPRILIANEGNDSAAGTGDNGDTISVMITDGTHTSTPTNTTVSGGTWSVGGIDASGLSDGTVTYLVTETDPAGNSTNDAQSTSKDTLAPTVAFTSTPNITAVNESVISAAGTGGNGDAISVAITDGSNTTIPVTTTVSGGTWSVNNINTYSLADGLVTYAVAETDAAGNTATITQYAIKETTAAEKPVIFPSTANLAANATTLIIHGFDFSANPARDLITFGGSAVGKVTHATATQLTVTGLGGLEAGTLQAAVTVNSVSSTPETVATVVPVVRAGNTTLAVHATTLVIQGFGFSPIAADNTVKFSNGATGNVTGASPTTLTVTGLSGAPAGSLAVIVTTNGISSIRYVQVAIVPITAPKLSASVIAPTQVTLSWSAVAGATSYKVEQLLANGTWALLFRVAGGTTSQVITVQPGSTYTFRVGAKDAFTAAFSAPVKVTSYTLAPTVTARSVAATQITLSWNALPGTTQYLIQELQANGTYKSLYTLGGSTTHLTFVEPPGGTNRYLVVAIGGHGKLNVSAQTANVALITLTWNAVVGATSYEVDQLSSGTWGKLATTNGRTTHETLIAQPGSSYTFRVGGIDAAGPDFSNSVMVTT